MHDPYPLFLQSLSKLTEPQVDNYKIFDQDISASYVILA